LLSDLLWLGNILVGRLDPERHPARVDVKAVTLRRFSLKKTGDVWEAFVILDIWSRI
jgi:SHS2 domain-containing protein